MSQQQTRILPDRVLRQPTTSFHQASRQQRRAPAKQAGLRILGGLLLTAGVALPVLETVGPLQSALGIKANMPTAPAPSPRETATETFETFRRGEGSYYGGYVPGPHAGYVGPADWALFEGGPHGGIVIPPAEIVQEWARAEAGGVSNPPTD